MNRMRCEGTKEVVEHLLTLGETMLCVDSRHGEVRVPALHRDKTDLRLVINLRFRHPVELLPEGIQADLLFGGVLHRCWIPYESLWGAYSIHTGEGTVWPDRMPADLRTLVGPRPASGDRSSPPGKRPSVEGPGPGGAGTSARPRRDPELRVVPGGKGKPTAP